MKPFPIFMSVAIICFVIIILLPQFARLSQFRIERLPVSVTSFNPAATLEPGVAVASSVSIDSPQAAELNGMPAETGSSTAPQIPGYPGLTEFAARLVNGSANDVVGVYVPGVMALPVAQQPNGQPDFVARENNLITQFSLPRRYGSTGLLAHNYLSGSRFAWLKESNDVVLVYGDGRLEHYRVSAIRSFQALKPNSPFSNFIDLADPSQKVMTSGELFNAVYTDAGSLVFQTCIDYAGEPSWGRLFVIAAPAEPLQLAVPAVAARPSSN